MLGNILENIPRNIEGPGELSKHSNPEYDDIPVVCDGFVRHIPGIFRRFGGFVADVISEQLCWQRGQLLLARRVGFLRKV